MAFHQDLNIIQNRKMFDKMYGIISVHPIPRPPQDSHLGETINEFQRYLNETKIEKTYLTLLKMLLSKEKLPYNPYPFFLANIRQFAEGQYINEQKTEDILPSFDLALEDTRIDYVYKSRYSDNIWGLPYIIQCCSPNSLKIYEWLWKDVIPPPHTMRSADHNYLIQPCVAMIGAAVFDGSFYQHVPLIKFRVEYRIVGPDLTHAIEVFINIVVKDLNHTEKSSEHILLGVSVPIDPEQEPMRYSSKFWQVDEINTRGDAFWDATVLAVTNRKYIVAELVFRLDPKMGIYKRGQKEYSFNFVQRGYRTEDPEILTPMGEFAEANLLEGFFMDRSHAESYITTFCPRAELVDKFKDYPNIPPSTEIKMSLLQRAKIVHKNVKSDENIRIDGFQIYGPIQFAPDSKKVTFAVKGAWERRIARCHLTSEIFEVINYIILLILMDKRSYSDEYLVQIYRFLRSTSARMNDLIQQNRFIREIIENFEKAEESQVVQRQFMEYRKGLQDLLNSVYRECSSDLLTCGRAIETRLYEMSHSQTGKGSNIILSPKSVLNLRFINHYCMPIFLQLVENVLPEVPLLVSFVEELKARYPEEVPSYPFVPVDLKFYYGYEDENIRNQRLQVIDVAAAKAESNEDPEVQHEGVLMKYLLDTRTDQVWNNFLTDILTSNAFPNNPYPKLITEMRRAALNMNLKFEENISIVKKLYHAKPQLLDPVTRVYQMQGSDAFGYQSALYAIDTAAFFSLTAFLFPLITQNYVKQKGVYRAAVCTAVTKDVAIYGRLDPYLRQVDMVDNIYIKGPSKCSKEGMELFCDIVTDYCKTLYNSRQFLVMGIYMGSIERKWSIKEIVERTRTFITELEVALLKKENVFVKLYCQYEWRYIAVIKYFRYRFVSYDRREYERFFHEDPTEDYQSIFFEKPKAAFHFQRGGAHECCDPFIGPIVKESMNYADDQIQKAEKNQDYFAVHKWLMFKSIAVNKHEHIAESWRMLHSSAATLNFLNCINKAMQDILFYIIADMPIQQNKEDEQNLTYDTFGVSESLFATTFGGYYHKLMDVLSDPVCLAPVSMAVYLRKKLNFLIFVTKSNNVVIKLESQSIRILEEIRQSTMCVENAIAADIHDESQEAVTTVNHIIKDKRRHRPVEVERFDREIVVEPVKAKVADRMNNWSFDVVNDL